MTKLRDTAVNLVGLNDDEKRSQKGSVSHRSDGSLPDDSSHGCPRTKRKKKKRISSRENIAELLSSGALDSPTAKKILKQHGSKTLGHESQDMRGLYDRALEYVLRKELNDLRQIKRHELEATKLIHGTFFLTIALPTE